MVTWFDFSGFTGYGNGNWGWGSAEVDVPDFDTKAYLEAYPDVANHPFWGTRPGLHWTQIGQSEGYTFYSKAERAERRTNEVKKEVTKKVDEIAMPKLPQVVKNPAPMPLVGDDKFMEARNRAKKEQSERRGRASTILTKRDIVIRGSH